MLRKHSLTFISRRSLYSHCSWLMTVFSFSFLRCTLVPLYHFLYSCTWLIIPHFPLITSTVLWNTNQIIFMQVDCSFLSVCLWCRPLGCSLCSLCLNLALHLSFTFTVLHSTCNSSNNSSSFIVRFGTTVHKNVVLLCTFPAQVLSSPHTG